MNVQKTERRKWGKKSAQRNQPGRICAVATIVVREKGGGEKGLEMGPSLGKGKKRENDKKTMAAAPAKGSMVAAKELEKKRVLAKRQAGRNVGKSLTVWRDMGR